MKDILERIAKGVMPVVLLRAKVLEVRDDATCDVAPLNGDAEIYDVKLKPVIDGIENSIVIFPKVGSFVVVGLVDGTMTDAYVLLTSDFDRIVFDDGVNEGMVKLPVLRAEIEKLNSFLTAIKDTFTNWTTVPSDGGAALKTAMNLALASEQTADLSDAGNDKILH